MDNLSKKIYFFFDTNLLDVNSMCSARDAMDVDSNDEHQGNSNLSFLKTKYSCLLQLMILVLTSHSRPMTRLWWIRHALVTRLLVP